MIILGIDPGTTSIGYAVLKDEGGSLSLLAADKVKISSHHAADRLKELWQEIKKVIARWKPDVAALERLFFAKNQKTALAVAEARGVILLTTALAGLKVYEYTPLEIKKIVTGDGQADKIQVQKMMRLTLPEAKNLKATDDVFDAMALALACHLKERLEKYLS